MTTRMQQRYGLSTQWTAINPILAVGEMGLEADTQKFKLGDGDTNWVDLPYFVNADLSPDVVALLATAMESVQTQIATAVSTAVSGLVDSAPAALNTLNELAAAINDDATFANTITTAISNKADSAHAHTLDSLSDVDVSAATTSQVLKKNADGSWGPGTVATTFSYNDLSDLPTTFTPSAHTHDASEILNTVKTVTAATYATLASDNGKIIVLNPSTTITVTVDDVLTAGQRIDLYLRGSMATFVAGTGVTLEGAGVTGVSLKMATRYTPSSIIYVSPGVYALVGSVETV